MSDEARAESLALYTHLRDSVADVLPEQPQVRDRIALLALRHATMGVMSRALVLAPPDIDVASIMSALAEALDGYHLQIPLGMVSGHGWHGAGLVDWMKSCGSDTSYALVTLTDLEALRVERGQYRGVSVTSQRFSDDVARSLAQVLAGEPLKSEAGQSIHTKNLLVVVTGEGAGLEGSSVGGLVDWGIPKTVAIQLARASLIMIKPPSPTALDLLLIDALADLTTFCRKLGFRLRIEPATYRYANSTAARDDHGGLTAAAAWIRAAAEVELIAALRAEHPAALITISPDSLEVPAAAPPVRWHE